MNKMKHSFTIFTLLFLFICACSVKKNTNQTLYQTPALSDAEQRLVDSVLQYGLENEALFTLLGNVKPMSSLVMYTFPIANDDSTKRLDGNILNRAEHGKYLDRIEFIQRAFNKVNLPDLKFILVPYVSNMDNKRNIQLSVVRISSLDSLLKAKENFYGQLGLVPGADPVVVATAIEGSGNYERWRGYGYLFGYPDYAVDFYNKASYTREKTGEFVNRKFFRIPTYSRVEGNFVYAYPDNHTLTADVDSAIYNKSMSILNKYREIRKNYLNPDSTVRAYKLLQDYYKK